MKRLIPLALAAAMVIPATAEAQGASVTEAHVMELGRKYVGWFYDNQADSLWNSMTEETQGRVGTPDAITDAMNNILSQAGLEMEMVGERVEADSAGNGFTYFRRVKMDQAPDQVLRWRFRITNEGQIAGANIQPAPPEDQ